MAVYATADDLDAYIADNEGVTAPGDDEAVRLLLRAERDVDRVVGPWPLFSDGRKFDPPSLTAPQQAALARATCAAAEFRLLVGEDQLVGDTEFVPEQLRVMRAAGRVAPKLLEELAGTGLIAYSGTVLTPLDEPG